MKTDRAGDLLQKIYSKIHSPGTAPGNSPASGSSHYSSHWEWYLKSKGAYHSLENMLTMRQPASSITRGFGLDRRFSSSYDLYLGTAVYRDILSIPESDFGDPEKLFFGVGSERRSGIFLRNACYACNIITHAEWARESSISVLEIGPGFGMLAYILKQYYPKARLVLVDLPETLSICAWYLENVLPECTFAYRPAEAGSTSISADITFVNADAFSAGMGRYDLAINCDSMSEMVSDVSCNYVRIIESDMNDGGMFFFLNKEGIDKNAVARPTLYPFSGHWRIRAVQPTYVGFLDDYRHIQLCLAWSNRTDPGRNWPQLRLRLLDMAYQYFYNERLDCFGMFEFMQDLGPHGANGGNGGTFLLDCISHEDLDYKVRQWQILSKEGWINGSERASALTGAVILCDLLISSQRQKEAEPIARALAGASNSFSETWAAGRILAELNHLEDARVLWGRAVELNDAGASLLLKAGKQLEARGQSDLATRAFERVVNEAASCPEKIEAAMRMRWTSPKELTQVFSRLPRHAFSIGYYIVRMADAFFRSGWADEAVETLTPLINKEVRAGHYDLFIAAQTLNSLNRLPQAEALIQEAISLGHNDNGFYRRIGLFFEQKGDYPSSAKYLKMSLDIDASWASTHYDLARIYRKLGPTDLEVSHLTEALRCSHNKEVDYASLRERLKALT
jgi:tetratricopeptide (TPR) repeat protein